MYYSDSDNKVVCQECGHVNYIHTTNVEVPVRELVNNDVGLLVKTQHNEGLLKQFNQGYDATGNFVAEIVLTETLMGGFTMDAYQHREFFTDPYDKVIVFRPTI